MFYKKELENDIRIEPSKTQEERSRMMELLKRFEEDSLEDEDDLNASDDDDALVVVARVEAAAATTDELLANAAAGLDCTRWVRYQYSIRMIDDVRTESKSVVCV